MTIADIYFYEAFSILKLISEATATTYKNLVHLYSEFENQEWFKAYKGSDRWTERTFFGPNAPINN